MEPFLHGWTITMARVSCQSEQHQQKVKIANLFYRNKGSLPFERVSEI